MGKTVYAVRGRDKDFGFNLEIFDNSRLLAAIRGRWQITNSSGLGLWGALLGPPGEWSYRTGPAGRLGFIFFMLAGTNKLPFVIALDEVPDDYLRGPFCRVATGKGTLSPSVAEDVPIVWRLAGPGCV